MSLFVCILPPQVANRQHLQPDFMESVMDLLALAEAVYAARGTKEYPALLDMLPEGFRDSYHKILQKGAQYVVTLFLAQRAVESIMEMDMADLVMEEDDSMEFAYWREVSSLLSLMVVTSVPMIVALTSSTQACRASSKNHYADLEQAHNGGVIPNLLLTTSTYQFNPASILETYLGMRNPEGQSRLMMKHLTSVTYKVHGCRPVKDKFNLHDPATTICFSGKEVVGKNTVAKMCEALASMLDLPKCTNSQLRSTAIQALRMAEFQLEDIQKVSRHSRADTITKHYDPGQRTSTRANMAVAIGQAAAMRRGEEFQPVAQALVKKVSKARVVMATPDQMIPRRSNSPLQPMAACGPGTSTTATAMRGDEMFQPPAPVSKVATAREKMAAPGTLPRRFASPIQRAAACSSTTGSSVEPKDNSLHSEETNCPSILETRLPSSLPSSFPSQHTCSTTEPSDAIGFPSKLGPTEGQVEEQVEEQAEELEMTMETPGSHEINFDSSQV